MRASQNLTKLSGGRGEKAQEMSGMEGERELE